MNYTAPKIEELGTLADLTAGNTIGPREDSNMRAGKTNMNNGKISS